MLQYVGLSCIIYNNKHLKFKIDVQSRQQTDRGKWYNTTIFSQLNGQRFKYFLKTGRKHRYGFMCSVDAYITYHVPMPDYASSGSGIPFANFII